MINVSSNISDAITVKDATIEGKDIPIAYLNASLDSTNKNFNISMTVINKELVEANAEIVRAKYAEFIAVVQTNAKELGYVVF